MYFWFSLFCSFCCSDFNVSSFFSNTFFSVLNFGILSKSSLLSFSYSITSRSLFLIYSKALLISVIRFSILSNLLVSAPLLFNSVFVCCFISSIRISASFCRFCMASLSLLIACSFSLFSCSLSLSLSFSLLPVSLLIDLFIWSNLFLACSFLLDIFSNWSSISVEIFSFSVIALLSQFSRAILLSFNLTLL